jgi:hypothetical protein
MLLCKYFVSCGDLISKMIQMSSLSGGSFNSVYYLTLSASRSPFVISCCFVFFIYLLLVSFLNLLLMSFFPLCLISFPLSSLFVADVSLDSLHCQLFWSICVPWVRYSYTVETMQFATTFQIMLCYGGIVLLGTLSESNILFNSRKIVTGSPSSQNFWISFCFDLIKIWVTPKIPSIQQSWKWPS